jgi:hypothetical protein
MRLVWLQIIMDGNSRWATRQGLPAFVGHERGVAALKAAVVTAREWGIQALTVRHIHLQLPASLLPAINQVASISCNQLACAVCVDKH